jgi:tRNA-specific 2-thiouridylase
MFMQNWHDTTGTLHGDCPWKDDLTVATLVAKQLDMPFHFVDLSAAYRRRVVVYMCAEYERGRTPNPDVLCNREIKFDAFLQACLDLGADYVGTGHYCRRETLEADGATTYRLLAGSDPNKDQSYFLCQLSQQQLGRALFPIGGMLKPEVRRIARALQLPTADKKDSQGICFVGKVDLPVFLQQRLKAKAGAIVELPKNLLLPPRGTLEAQAQPYAFSPSDGKVVGQHSGAHFYTIGQRRGLSVGGHVEPLFVVATDVERNVVYVGEGHDHPALHRPALMLPAAEVHWLRPALAMREGEVRPYAVRIRYRQPLQGAQLHCRREGIYVAFDQPQRGVAAGQFAAWYEGDELVGSGVIA